MSNTLTESGADPGTKHRCTTASTMIDETDTRQTDNESSASFPSPGETPTLEKDSASMLLLSRENNTVSHSDVSVSPLEDANGGTAVSAASDSDSSSLLTTSVVTECSETAIKKVQSTPAASTGCSLKEEISTINTSPLATDCAVTSQNHASNSTVKERVEWLQSLVEKNKSPCPISPVQPLSHQVWKKPFKKDTTEDQIMRMHLSVPILSGTSGWNNHAPEDGAVGGESGHNSCNHLDSLRDRRIVKDRIEWLTNLEKRKQTELPTKSVVDSQDVVARSQQQRRRLRTLWNEAEMEDESESSIQIDALENSCSSFQPSLLEPKKCWSPQKRLHASLDQKKVLSSPHKRLHASLPIFDQLKLPLEQVEEHPKCLAEHPETKILETSVENDICIDSDVNGIDTQSGQLIPIHMQQQKEQEESSCFHDDEKKCQSESVSDKKVLASIQSTLVEEDMTSSDPYPANVLPMPYNEILSFRGIVDTDSFQPPTLCYLPSSDISECSPIPCSTPQNVLKCNSNDDCSVLFSSPQFDASVTSSPSVQHEQLDFHDLKPLSCECKDSRNEIQLSALANVEVLPTTTSFIKGSDSSLESAVVDLKNRFMSTELCLVQPQNNEKAHLSVEVSPKSEILITSFVDSNNANSIPSALENADDYYNDVDVEQKMTAYMQRAGWKSKKKGNERRLFHHLQTQSKSHLSPAAAAGMSSNNSVVSAESISMSNSLNDKPSSFSSLDRLDQSSYSMLLTDDAYFRTPNVLEGNVVTLKESDRTKTEMKPELQVLRSFTHASSLSLALSSSSSEKDLTTFLGCKGDILDDEHDSLVMLQVDVDDSTSADVTEKGDELYNDNGVVFDMTSFQRSDHVVERVDSALCNELGGDDSSDDTERVVHSARKRPASVGAVALIPDIAEEDGMNIFETSSNDSSSRYFDDQCADNHQGATANATFFEKFLAAIVGESADEDVTESNSVLSNDTSPICFEAATKNTSDPKLSIEKSLLSLDSTTSEHKCDDRSEADRCTEILACREGDSMQSTAKSVTPLDVDLAVNIVTPDDAMRMKADMRCMEAVTPESTRVLSLNAVSTPHLNNNLCLVDETRPVVVLLSGSDTGDFFEANTSNDSCTTSKNCRSEDRASSVQEHEAMRREGGAFAIQYYWRKTQERRSLCLQQHEEVRFLVRHRYLKNRNDCSKSFETGHKSNHNTMVDQNKRILFEKKLNYNTHYDTNVAKGADEFVGEKMSGLNNRFMRCDVNYNNHDEQDLASQIISKNLRGCLVRLRYLNSIGAIERIQSVSRGSMAKAKFTLMRANCIVIQAFLRGCFTRRLMLTLSVSTKAQVLAAVMLQQYVRRFIVRIQYIEYLSSAILLQAIVRGKAAKFGYQRLRCSCIVLQSCFRCWQAKCFRRRHFEDNWKEGIVSRSVSQSHTDQVLCAIVAIQATWRGFIVRLSESRTHNAQDELNTAATTVAKIWRASRDRSMYVELLSSAVLIQAVWRGYFTKKRQSRHSSTVMIQAYARGLVSRRNFVRFRAFEYAATAMQKAFRRYSVMIKIVNWVAAAKIIQAFMKGCISRQRLAICKSSCISIQMVTRRWLARRLVAKIREYKLSAQLIQKIIRGFFARRYFSNYVVAAERVQAAYRRHIASIEFQSTYKKLVVIQRCMREYLASRSTINQENFPCFLATSPIEEGPDQTPIQLTAVEITCNNDYPPAILKKDCVHPTFDILKEERPGKAANNNILHEVVNLNVQNNDNVDNVEHQMEAIGCVTNGICAEGSNIATLEADKSLKPLIAQTSVILPDRQSVDQAFSGRNSDSTNAGCGGLWAEQNKEQSIYGPECYAVAQGEPFYTSVATLNPIMANYTAVDVTCFDGSMNFAKRTKLPRKNRRWWWPFNRKKKSHLMTDEVDVRPNTYPNENGQVGCHSFHTSQCSANTHVANSTKVDDDTRAFIDQDNPSKMSSNSSLEVELTSIRVDELNSLCSVWSGTRVSNDSDGDSSSSDNSSNSNDSTSPEVIESNGSNNDLASERAVQFDVEPIHEDSDESVQSKASNKMEVKKTNFDSESSSAEDDDIDSNYEPFSASRDLYQDIDACFVYSSHTSFDASGTSFSSVDNSYTRLHISKDTETLSRECAEPFLRDSFKKSDSTSHLPSHGSSEHSSMLAVSQRVEFPEINDDRSYNASPDGDESDDSDKFSTANSKLSTDNSTSSTSRNSHSSAISETRNLSFRKDDCDSYAHCGPTNYKDWAYNRDEDSEESDGATNRCGTNLTENEYDYRSGSESRSCEDVNAYDDEFADKPHVTDFYNDAVDAIYDYSEEIEGDSYHHEISHSVEFGTMYNMRLGVGAPVKSWFGDSDVSFFSTVESFDGEDEKKPDIPSRQHEENDEEEKQQLKQQQELLQQQCFQVRLLGLAPKVTRRGGPPVQSWFGN